MRLHRSEHLLGAALFVLLAVHQQCVSADPNMLAPPEVTMQNGTMYAACKLRPINSLPDGVPRVYGHVLFKQDHPDGKLNVIFRLKGFPTDVTPEPQRAVHIHQYGDLGQECKASGGHYNPRDEHHPNHPGDFGNFQPQGGKIHMLMELEATLFGGLSVIGRAVVVHEKMDDLGLGGDEGSLLNGNAGRRIGCCVIGIYPATLWNMYHEQLQNSLLRGN
ncbi:extracellular superoxide dismutase [Cu-Zn]-like [Platichthys flesus]|uniref:extracellular superoxide dismutase [Cu-Zn]-like n=1 Tax=Platichthys flesus TaxID=8260 RepID=UPI002DB75F4A|nr:extracellular superoxide dismutase [Cu-Zn]-like [Platichthys flesus]